jgi:hypothetical protein
MPHVAQDFRQVLELDERTLRELISGEGDAPERLWAAWALALRRDREAASILRRAATGDPSPGVRAHLALLLVAQGEIAAAVTLARLDAEAIVRSSACRHLTRVAKPTDARLQELIATAMRSDTSPEVHAAIADAVRLDAAEEVWTACTRRLRDPDDRVRANVVDALLRRHASGSSLASDLRVAATSEERPDLRASMLRAWIGAEGRRAVVRAVGDRRAQQVLNLLQFFEEENADLDPEDVESLLARNEAAIDSRVAFLHRKGVVRLPVRWLLALALREREHGVADGSHDSWRRWEAATVAIEALRNVLPGETQVHSADERQLVNRLRESIEEELRSIASQVGTDVDTLVRYAFGDGMTGDQVVDEWPSADDEYYVPRGAELLPELRRLATA